MTLHWGCAAKVTDMVKAALEVTAPAKVTKLLVLHDPKTGEDVKKRPRLLKSYQTATVEITMSDKVCVEKYEDFASLGRLVLRLGGRTVGVGKVVKVYHT